MRTVQIKVSETDFQMYNFGNEEIKFTDLVEMISREFARKALLECNKIAEQVGLSEMTMDEINAEIKAVRDAKTHS
jgi:SHS2 domain-containing protein